MPTAEDRVQGQEVHANRPRNHGGGEAEQLIDHISSKRTELEQGLVWYESGGSYAGTAGVTSDLPFEAGFGAGFAATSA